MHGRVTQFDVEVGLGEVMDDGGEVFSFHCVSIADGSRNIAVGTTVEFELLPKLGRYEAARITPE
ncbi:MAG TPA: hypothetical protein VLD86_09420 [Ilumatobacteraceae bacterium]|nr:hypothetical protein [Ilumatobacteraceae bacterium]